MNKCFSNPPSKLLHNEKKKTLFYKGKPDFHKVIFI